MSGKIRIKIGEMEIECEGTEEFLKTEFPGLLKSIAELRRFGMESAAPRSVRQPRGEMNLPSLTTGSIAAKLSVSSGFDLVIAAAAHLALVEGKESFSRPELLQQMQGATAYYKKTYSGNLTRLIKTVLKEDKLSEISSNIFTLTASARADLEKRLANE